MVWAVDVLSGIPSRDYLVPNGVGGMSGWGGFQGLKARLACVEVMDDSNMSTANLRRVEESISVGSLGSYAER